jgi:hypothetical protein
VFNFWQWQEFLLFTTASRLTLGTTQPLIQWVAGTVLSTFMIAYYSSYACKRRSFTVWQECRLRMFENEVLKKTFEPEKEQKNGNNYALRSLMMFTLHLMLLGP